MTLSTPAPIARAALLHDATAIARRAAAVPPLFLNCLTDHAHMARVGAVGHLDADWLAPGLIRERDRFHEEEQGLEPQTGLVVGATTKGDRLAFLLGGLVNQAFSEVFGSEAALGPKLDAAILERLLIAGCRDAFEDAVGRAGYADRREALGWIWRDDLHRALAECHTMSPDMVNSGLWLERMYAQYARWNADSQTLANAIIAQESAGNEAALSFGGLPLFLDTDAAFRTVKALRRGAFLPQPEAEDAIAEPATCAYGLAVRRAVEGFVAAARLWDRKSPSLAKAA